MALSPILKAPQVAPNQNQKEATINTAQMVFEAAMNDVQALSMASANRTLTSDQFTKYFHTRYTGHTVPRTVTIPATVRFFAASNEGTANLTFHCTGSSGQDLVVPADKKMLILSDGTNITAISQGVSLLSDLTDVIGALDASAGQLLGFASGTWSPVDNAFDPGFYYEGAPPANKRLLRQIITRSVRFASDFNGSLGDADLSATANTTMEVYKNGTLVGYINFAAASDTATFSTNVGAGSTTVTFAPGDLLTIEASAYPDATLAGITVTLKGVYI